MTKRPPRQATPGIALVLLLHLALVWLALRPVRNPLPRDHWVWLNVAPTMSAGKRVTVPAPASPRAGRPVTPRAGIKPQEATAPLGTTPATPAPAPDSPEEQALMASPPASAPAGKPPAADIMQQALKSAGAIDRQLRAEHPQEFTAPPDTPRSRLIRGLAAAHAAVAPKWFEQAKIELFSAPNDPRRIYRVTTAMGEYCLFYPDKGSIATNADAKSGWAGFGQPTAAKCPIEF